jgi:hypothetical protein
MVLILGLVQPAAAQINAGELSVGYSFLANDSLAVNASNLPLGVFFDSAFRLNERISLAGDLSVHMKRGIAPSDSLDRVVPPLPTQDFQGFSFNRPETGFCTSVLSECSVDIMTVSGVGGPRFHLSVGRARPFVHVLAGVTRSVRRIDFFKHTSTNFTIQPGAGIDVDATDRVAFHVQGDYRRVFFGVPDQNNPGASLVSKDGADDQDFVLSVGVAFKLGQLR